MSKKRIVVQYAPILSEEVISTDFGSESLAESTSLDLDGSDGATEDEDDSPNQDIVITDNSVERTTAMNPRFMVSLVEPMKNAGIIVLEPLYEPILAGDAQQVCDAISALRHELGSYTPAIENHTDLPVSAFDSL